MIFLLGGPPRAGKSIIANVIRQKHALSVVSTDSLGAVLESVLSAEVAPDLFVLDKFNEMPMAQRVKVLTEDPAVMIEYVRRESHVVWRAVESLVRAENHEGRDALIEGVAVLPELISQLDDVLHRVVFIGNQGVGHEESIRKSAQDHEHDWMRGANDEYISAFAVFVREMSSYIEQEAGKYGFRYIEMDEEPFGNVAEAVMKSLGLSAS